MDIFSEAKKGWYFIPDDLRGVLPDTVVLSLESNPRSLCIFSEAYWEERLTDLLEKYPAKRLVPTIYKAMNASAHKAIVRNGLLHIPETLLQRAGLQFKSLRIKYSDGIGQISPVSERAFGQGLPVELSLSGKYYIQNEDGLLSVNYSTTGTELWLEHDGDSLRILPPPQGKGEEGCFSPDLDFDLASLNKKYTVFFSRGMKVLNSFSDGKLPLLNFFISYGLPAVELAEDCPAMAYIAAQSCFFGFNSPGFNLYQRLAEEKRSKILQAAGFPTSRWVEKLFRKIPAVSCYASFFYDLKKLLQSADPKQRQLLSHLREINHMTIKILRNDDFSQLFHSSFFDKIPQLIGNSSAVDSFGQLYQVKDELTDAVSRGLQVRLIRRGDDLVVVHNQLVRWLRNQSYLREIEDIIFSAPPFPEYLLSADNGEGRCGIFPITTGRDLWLEGKAMQHCIAGYAKDISLSHGRLYAYHVEIPDEDPATLTILYRQGESWRVRELRGIRNAKVSSRVVSFVESWLEKQTDIYFGYSDG